MAKKTKQKMYKPKHTKIQNTHSTPEQETPHTKTPKLSRKSARNRWQDKEQLSNYERFCQVKPNCTFQAIFCSFTLNPPQQNIQLGYYTVRIKIICTQH